MELRFLHHKIMESGCILLEYLGMEDDIDHVGKDLLPIISYENERNVFLIDKAGCIFLSVLTNSCVLVATFV